MRRWGKDNEGTAVYRVQYPCRLLPPPHVDCLLLAVKLYLPRRFTMDSSMPACGSRVVPSSPIYHGFIDCLLLTVKLYLPCRFIMDSSTACFWRSSCAFLADLSRIRPLPSFGSQVVTSSPIYHGFVDCPVLAVKLYRPRRYI